MPNLKIVKTPITPIKISLALRGEEFITGTIEEEAFDIDYVAPDAKILLVDDNAINLTVAEGLLEPSKIQITPVTSGKEALMQIENTMFDMILMDHMMPDLDGVETTKLIRGFHPDYKDVPILALTANAIEGTREMFLESGMNDVIPKPIELKTMALKVRKWLPQEKILKKSEIPSEGEEAVSKADTDLMIGDLDIKGATTLLGNEKLFMKILGEYYSTIPAKEREIKLSLDTMNIHEYTIQVHALKSSSRQIGANELADMAAKMELAGNHNDIDSILENSDTMLDKYHSYIDILAPWFEKEESEEEKAEKTEADNETLIALFGQLKEASEELDMDGMEQVGEELKKYEFKGAEKDLYTEILDAIEAIDSEECLSIMDKWRAERGIQE